MDEKKQQITFDIKPPATLILMSGERINSSVYRMSEEGISFITKEKPEGLFPDAKQNPEQENYIFTPWHQIKSFLVETDRGEKKEPIASTTSAPQG